MASKQEQSIKRTTESLIRWCICTRDLLLCCSHTVVNGLLSHRVASQLITEPTVGIVVFSSPVQSTGRAIVVTLASAFALALAFPSRHF